MRKTFYRLLKIHPVSCAYKFFSFTPNILCTTRTWAVRAYLALHADADQVYGKCRDKPSGPPWIWAFIMNTSI